MKFLLLFILSFSSSFANALTYNEAQWLASRAAQDSEIPIYMNEVVYKHLKRYVSSESWRNTLRVSFERMQQYEKSLTKIVDEVEAPKELLAIPVRETAYLNIKVYTGTGLWGFTRPTARHFGLRVDDKVDERLNVKKSTKAALTYIQELYERYGDYGLALKAYNWGPAKLDEVMKKYNTRDPFEIEKKSPMNHQYYSLIMAAIIVMKNPHLLEEK